MTGDGVNDVLALREADCSVSVASGSAAARNISEIVLADNDFSHMPEVVAEGRRSINNLQRSASLFLVKTVYTAVLALICIVAPPYPFIPIQMTLISASIIGIPSFVLALEPNHERVHGKFLVSVFSHSLPASAAIIVALVCGLIAERVMGLSFQETSTICMLLVTIVGVCLIWRISQPMNPLRWALLVVVISIVAVGCTLFADVFMVAPLTVTMGVFVVVVGVLSGALFNSLYDASLKNLESGRIAELVSGVERTYDRRKQKREERGSWRRGV
jgi:cation-transporting ATPase E